MNSLTRISHRLACGFSLLELLLVLVIMALLASLAMPQWQQQQQQVRRQLAWLQLQHIALTQAEYQQQQGVYAHTMEDLGIPAADSAYGYRLTSFADGFQIVAQVLVPGPQQGDSRCWQLFLHSRDGEYGVSKTGQREDLCR